jgi:hypothetical protein
LNFDGVVGLLRLSWSQVHNRGNTDTIPEACAAVIKFVQKTIFCRNIICVEKKICYEQYAAGVLSALSSMPVKDRTPPEFSDLADIFATQILLLRSKLVL